MSTSKMKEKNTKKLPPHLGGHFNVTHVDLNAIQHIRDKYQIKTSYDLGCGPGGMIKTMSSIGIKSTGIDGDFTLPNSKEIILHDFTTGPLKNLTKADLCWSTEFLEHVEEKYMDNYFSVFKACSYVFCTASENPNGYHHVNLQNTEYWINRFSERGFLFLPEDTRQIRKNSSMKKDFVRDTGMFFRRDFS